MNLSTRIATLVAALTLVTGLAAISIPDAWSGHQDLGTRSGLGQSTPVRTPDALDRYLRNNAPSALHRDGRAAARGVDALADGDASDALSRYLVNNRPEVATDGPTIGTGFDWRNVGVGGVFGILILAAVAILLGRERRGPLTTLEDGSADVRLRSAARDRIS